MGRLKIQQVFDSAWKGYASSFCPSLVQVKAASSIMACKSRKLGCNVSVCADCGHMDFHSNSGGGLSGDGKLKVCGNGFFIPVRVLAAKFRGKLLASLDTLYKGGKLSFSGPCSSLADPAAWASLRDTLYHTAWYPHVRETFNGFGNAIEYLGRYADRIAITNVRVKSVTAASVSFMAKGYRNGSVLKEVPLSCREFIRRFMMYVLPPGFQKIRYYGFLSNRFRKKRLAVIFRIQGHQRFESMLAGLPMDQVLYSLWGVNVHVCTRCGCLSMRPLGRSYVLKG